MCVVRLFLRVFWPLVFQPHGRNRVRVALAGLALTTTVRVIDRVHHHAADGRANATPADGARLAVAAQVVLAVADFADRGAAINMNLARLIRAQAHCRVHAFACGELHGTTGTARELCTLAGLQLDAVDRGADRDVADLHGAAGLDRRLGTRDHGIARDHALGRDDVATLAVRVQHQREVGGAVRIVLKTLYLARDAVLVTQEIDDAVLLLVTTALVAHGLATRMVAGTRRMLVLDEGLDRAALVQVRTIDLHLEASAWRRRFGFDESHDSLLTF